MPTCHYQLAVNEHIDDFADEIRAIRNKIDDFSPRSATALNAISECQISTPYTRLTRSDFMCRATTDQPPSREQAANNGAWHHPTSIDPLTMPTQTLLIFLNTTPPTLSPSPPKATRFPHKQTKFRHARSRHGLEFEKVA